MLRRKSVQHICPCCHRKWDEKELGHKQRIARKLIFMGSTVTLMGISLPNPFHPLLPLNEPEEWCNRCLREYMHLDNMEMDWTTIEIKIKEESEGEPS